MNKEKKYTNFEEYYNKRYLEECKVFLEKPKFSMKYMMIMSHLREVVRNQCLKEYKQKYPWASIENQKNEIKNSDSFDTEFVILDKNETNLQNENENENNRIKSKKVTNSLKENTSIRRSERLKNKNNYNFHKT